MKKLNNKKIWKTKMKQFLGQDSIKNYSKYSVK